jgi:hypothetical protein
MTPEEVLAKLSPHRTHESNWVKTALCTFGLHRWYHPKLDALNCNANERYGDVTTANDVWKSCVGTAHCWSVRSAVDGTARRVH